MFRQIACQQEDDPGSRQYATGLCRRARPERKRWVNAQAQNYPNRPITLVIPFAPGGSTTIVGRGSPTRWASCSAKRSWSTTVPAPAAPSAPRRSRRAIPTATRCCSATPARWRSGPSLYKNVGYDPRKDFAPIGLIGNAPNSLVVNPSFPAKTVAELVAYAKANPGKVNFGSAGAGTVSHITGEYFARAAGIKLVHIPYKGTGPALTDLIGGHIPMAFAPIPASHPQRHGRQDACAGGDQPDALEPAAGRADHRGSGPAGLRASLHYGLAAPAGTPRPIIDKLNKALRDALASDEVKKQLGNDGTEITPGTPEDYADFIDKDEKKWSRPRQDQRRRAGVRDFILPFFHKGRRKDGGRPVSGLTSRVRLLQRDDAPAIDSPVSWLRRARAAGERAARCGDGCTSILHRRRDGASGLAAGDRGISPQAGGVSGRARRLRGRGRRLLERRSPRSGAAATPSGASASPSRSTIMC